MVQAAVATEIVDRAQRTGLFVARAVVNTIDTRVDQSSDTHHAGFERHVKIGAVEAMLPEVGACIT